MKYPAALIVFICLLTACSSDGEGDFSGSSGDTSGGSQGNGNGNLSGQITAGEWRDLDAWPFWLGLMNDAAYSETQTYWGFYTNNRLDFKIVDSNNNPANAVLVSVLKDGEVVSEAKTDNFGSAVLFLNINTQNPSIDDLSAYSIAINSIPVSHTLQLFTQGVNEISMLTTIPTSNAIEISFIVDATGSMGDEMEFLKSDLQNVISQVQSENQSSNISTSAVFYRDNGDDYVVKHSDFTSDISTTINYIREQSANGGGDFPEAVDVALGTAINTLQWSSDAKTKIAFLLLDAPPHHELQMIQSIQQSVKNAASKGIKIIPITASGIDKPTEFLMRYLAIATNGTYVFITNDSGIGNEHLEPTIGDYQVEFLNNLMVRLINKYSE